jgi:hypothetical protein
MKFTQRGPPLGDVERVFAARQATGYVGGRHGGIDSFGIGRLDRFLGIAHRSTPIMGVTTAL